jgi:hypothetical protein
MCYAWFSLMIVLGLTAVISLVTTFDSYPVGLWAPLYFDRSGLLYVVTAGVIFVCLQRYRFDVDQNSQERQNAEYQSLYQLFLQGEETSLPSLDTAKYGYPPMTPRRCYMGRVQVVPGFFQSWDSEISKEIGGEFKFGPAATTAKWSEKAKRVMESFVEQAPGTLLIFEDGLVFFICAKNVVAGCRGNRAGFLARLVSGGHRQ